VHTGRVTRVVEFGAFVQLEPGVEALAHASTFAPTGNPEEWSKAAVPGTTAAFEILAIDPAKKRISVALVPAAQETEDARQYAEREQSGATPGSGLLADKLRRALAPRDE
jgi:small subunit ribosomal protein S1